MNISLLQMQNFRNHKDTTLMLDKINFFIGGNNAGKTSILAAIEWALTGHCRWTDKAGRGATDLIKQGEKKSAVTLQVEGIGGIVRSMPPTTLHVGKKVGINQGQAEIYNRFTVTEEQLKAALNANAFLSMSTAEQRAFLFSAFGYSWTREKAAAALTRWLIKNGYAEDTVTHLVNVAKDWYPANITGGPEVLETMEKRAKDYRRDIKRDKQRMEATLAELETDTIINTPPPGEFKIKLAELRSKRDQLLSTANHLDISQRRETLLSRIQTKEIKIQTASNKLAEVTARLQQIEQTTSNYDNAQEKDLQEKVKSFEAEANIFTTIANTAQEKINTLIAANQALSCADKRCPLAPEIIECGMSESQLKDLLHFLDQEYQNAKDTLSEAFLQSEHINLQLTEASKQLAKINQIKKTHEDQAKQATILNGEAKTQRLLIDQLTADKDALATELNSLSTLDETKLADTNHMLHQLDNLIAKTETALHKAYEAEALKQRKETLKVDINTITAELASLEVLVKALAPNGVRRDMLNDVLKEFLQRANDRLGRLTAGAYHLTLNNDMELICRANGGPLLPLKLLSRSEQLRVGIAIQESLSNAAGLRFIAIDEADILDQENRDLLANMLLDLAAEYDQVLVFTTVGDVKPQNPGLPNLKMFWVEEGTVKELEPSS